ncbi:MAG: gliding motility-associated C-terminal domain-containing protein [Crocinitomicaceae bacterium]|nr:gliding motility-associated C-terminal domain-containing protein [Crocinitomicaceae bacterium]
MKLIILTFASLLISSITYSQCGINVPNYVIDLSGAPDSTWVLYEADAQDRLGQCCGAPSNYNCISFDITLDSNSAGIFFDYDGAGAYGSLNWQIDCGPQYNLKDTICVTDPGPFTLTFCKPGTDNGNYTLVSVPKPTFPDDQVVPMNCVQPVEALGVTAQSISWNSISPGNPGDYNYLLDCTNCLDPVFTPDPNGPTYVEFEVQGYPILDYCVGSFIFSDTVSFTIQDSLKVFATPQTATFCSGGNAIINASATGGDGNYNFYWYDNALNQIATGPTFTTNQAGTYTVEVRDGNYEPGSCDEFFKTFTVSEVNPPVVDAGADQVLCADNPSSSLVGNVQNATGGIWSGGAGSYISSNTDLTLTYIPTSSEIASGSVTLTLTSTGAGGGCANNSDEIILFFVDTIQTDLADMSLNCNSSETLIDPVVTGGLSPLTYSWSDGTSGTSTTLGEGTHCLSINDANGCTYSDCFTISVPPSLNISMSSTPATVNGGSDGTATASVTGGTPPFSYSWNSGGTAATETGLSYGIYTVTVTDGNGCQINGSVVVNEPQCNGFSVNTSSTSVLCFGDSTGSASVTTVGGTSPFSFQWNDYASQTTSTANNLPAGTYEITVTDDNGCLAHGTINITEPDVVSNTFTHTDVTVQGGSDGSAQANVSGGTGSYNYAWSTGSSVDNISGVPTGWYSVTITDDNSCTLQDSLFISEPPCNTFDIFVGTSSVSCNGGNDGDAVLTIINGTGPFSINWSTLETDTTYISGLSADIYTVEVTDAQNCYAFYSFGVNEPSALTTGMLTTPSTCNGADNGTIDLMVSGGTFPPYTYLWNNGNTNEDRINLSPGTYSVTVSDQNGCTSVASTTVTEPDVLQVAYTSQDVTCFEGTDGSIDITVVGGTPSYSFDWSNGGTTEDLSGLDVGGYILNLSDGNSCSTEGPITILINEPEKVVADSIVVACPVPGSTVAQVSVTPIGGTANYSLSFDGGINYLSYGDYNENMPVDNSYNLVVQDVNGCLSDTYVVEIDTNVIASDISFNLCYYGAQTTEIITVTPGGGTADYSVSTDNGVSFNPALDYDISVNINNSYNIVVMDSKGCYSESYAVTLPDVMTLAVNVTSDFNGEDISCFGSSDGSAGSTVTGGTTPYNYSWSNGASTPNLSGLNAGTYTLTVIDDNGCSLNESITLINPTQLTSNANVSSNYNGEDVSCYGSSDGQGTAAGNGGVGPYTYLWSNGQTGATATGLSTGTYNVVITDLNGCQTNNSIFLSQPDTLGIITEITDVSCNGGNDGAIDVTSSGGVSPYNYQWNHGPTTEDVTNLAAGTYQVSLTDANGCVYVLDELVVDPTAIDLDLTMTDALCKSDSNGAADLSVTGGTPPYTYLWNTGATSEDIDSLLAGTYAVTVTDDNGCWTVINGAVNEPDSLSFEAVISDALCYGYSDGEITLTVSGGTLPYTYSWDNGITTNINENLSEGEYTVTVTDGNNCVLGESYAVNHPDSLWASLDAPVNFHDHHITFYGGSDGALDLEVTGGTAPYDYDWSNGESTEDLDGLTSGTYEVIITDDHGCTYKVGMELVEPYDLELPTAMTPNGDGKNDTYHIRGLEAYPNNSFVVTNRWGNVVFEADDYTNDWTGVNNNGKDLPDGVYYVIVKINDGEIELKNFVELRRK